MEKKIPARHFADLSGYPLGRRLMIRSADIVFYLAVRFVGKTLRYETIGGEHLDDVERARRLPILTFWHDRIFAGSYYFRNRGIYVMSSKSFDGEYISRFIQRFGYGVVRGSSSRGGMRALVEMIKIMRKGYPMAFTPDGPRGPQYVAKTGSIVLAKKTGNPIVPFVVEVERHFKVGSWDRMQIPFPFSKAAVIIGKPIYVKPDATEDEMDADHARMQVSLNDLVKRGEQWRNSGH